MKGITMAAADRDLRRKVKKEKMESEDGIDKLPDDILINILSRLTIKEAVKTSILSSRWRFLWPYFTGALDFDDLADMRCFDLPWYIRRERLLGSIDKVLGSLKAKDQSLEELRICLDLDSSCDVDSWVKFAIQKRVQRLELAFHINRCKRYNFPSHFESGSLTSLHLAGVQLRTEALENLLCYCPFLEELSLEWIKSLFRIRISGPSLKLKYLELNCLLNLEDLEIDAPNLITFEYSGPELNVYLKNVPSLAEISIEGDCCESLLPDLFRFSDVVWQLRTLNLELGDMPDQGVLCNIPELPNLEHLDIFFAISRDCFLPCAAFLKVCPLLYTLTLSSRCLLSRYERKIKRHNPHLSLRVVELVGFEMHTGNVEFLMDLLESATQLEKVIIDYIDAERIEEDFHMETEEYYQSARTHATQLAAKFPQLEFVIP